MIGSSEKGKPFKADLPLQRLQPRLVWQGNNIDKIKRREFLLPN
jgi:hypothetical protein